jgi:hypothetical protein
VVGKLKKLNDVEFVDFSEYANALGSDIAQLEKKLLKMKRAHKIFRKLAAEQIIESPLEVTEVNR